VTRCAALVLAAGEGSRLGRPKALVLLGGELLVDRTVRTAHEAGCDPVVVVLGASAQDVVATAALPGALVLVNDAWPDGMGASLRVGLRALAEIGAESAVVLLVDQPRVTADLVRRIATAPAARAVAASYGGRLGNPVRLHAAIWDDVCASAVGDVGARAWMRTHPDDVEAVACDDLGSDDDIDTAEDLIAAKDLSRQSDDAKMEPTA
jgi:CTP:molybdopterin cytidylyltransferase MocA